MDKRLIAIVIIVGLLGLGFIVLPPLIEEKQLENEAEEYAELYSLVHVPATETETDTPEAIVTEEPAVTEMIGVQETPVPETTPEIDAESNPAETVTPDPDEATATPEPGEQASAVKKKAPEDWNPFGVPETPIRGGLFAMSAKLQESKKTGTYYGGLFSRVDSDDKAAGTGKYTGVNFARCKAINGDFVAWLKIPGTNVNYPVVHSNNIDYYLNHTFNGAASKVGTLFSLGKCDWETPSKNLLIYGHHVESSADVMFHPLIKLKNASYYQSHNTLYLDSIYHNGKYQIFAVCDIEDGTFDFTKTTFYSDEDFLNFIDNIKSRALFNTGVAVDADDEIVTMITCDRYFKRRVGRLVVMAKKIAD